MIKIVIGGQLAKQEIEQEVKKIAGNQVELTIKGDLDAAMALKSGQADFYIGACETGSGGALAMPIAIVGKSQSVTLASPSSIMSAEQIEQEVKNGKTAFGFTKNSKDQVLPILIPALLQK